MKKQYVLLLSLVLFAVLCQGQTQPQAAPVPTGHESPDVLRRMTKLSLMKRGFTEYGEDVKGRTVYYGKEEKKYVYIDEDGLEIALNPNNLQMKNGSGASASTASETDTEASANSEQSPKKKRKLSIVNVSADVSSNKSEHNKTEVITGEQTTKTENQKTDAKKAATEVKTVRKD